MKPLQSVCCYCNQPIRFCTTFKVWRHVNQQDMPGTWGRRCCGTFRVPSKSVATPAWGIIVPVEEERVK